MKLFVCFTLFLIQLFCEETFGVMTREMILAYDERYATRFGSQDAQVKFKVLGQQVITAHVDVIRNVPNFGRFIKETSRYSQEKNLVEITSASQLFVETRSNVDLRRYVEKNLEPSLPNAFKIFVKSLYVGYKAIDDVKSLEEAILLRKLYNRFSGTHTAELELNIKFRELTNEQNHVMLYEYAQLRQLENVINQYINYINQNREKYLKQKLMCDNIGNNPYYLDVYLSGLRLPVDQLVSKIKEYRNGCNDTRVSVYTSSSQFFPRTILNEMVNFNQTELQFLLKEKLITKEQYDFEMQHRKPPLQAPANCNCGIENVYNIDIDIKRKTEIVSRSSVLSALSAGKSRRRCTSSSTKIRASHSVRNVSKQ